jgi:hypothetical protein
LCCRISPVPSAFRRLLLQIGGANIASADRALKAAGWLLALFDQDSGARDPTGH